MSDLRSRAWGYCSLVVRIRDLDLVVGLRRKEGPLRLSLNMIGRTTLSLASTWLLTSVCGF